MAITAYQKEIAPGEWKVFYLVVAEAINKYTGRRIQKKRRGIPSKPKALHVYKELWSMCREERPEELTLNRWDALTERYFAHIESKIRSAENPSGFSPQVVRTKQSRFKKLQVLNTLHLDLVTPQLVSDKLDVMEHQGVSRVYTNLLLMEVKCIFSFAVQSGLVKANPFLGFKKRRVPKRRKEALTHEEANKLLIEAKKRDHPYYHIWLLSLTLGVRRSELAGLKWSDVDFDQALVYLRRQLIPREGIVDFLKDREERVVAIPKYVIPTLKEMKLRSKSDFVIERGDHRWNCGQQALVLRAFCKEIGIKEITHHQLRATHITLALVDGIPLGIVKENVGHSKLSTTDEYFRSAGINMRGQTDGLRLRVPEEVNAEVIPLKRG